MTVHAVPKRRDKASSGCYGIGRLADCLHQGAADNHAVGEASDLSGLFRRADAKPYRQWLAGGGSLWSTKLVRSVVSLSRRSPTPTKETR